MTGGRTTGRWDTLERLLAPRREQFVREHWGRLPLLLNATERMADHADLFSPAAVDELLTGRGLRAPFLRMAREGSTLVDREFTTGGGVGAGVTDQVDEDAVRRRFAAGATIVLQGLHRTWPAIAALAGSLSEELGHPVQVNAYITPPGNQGFSAHYDVHDVFVLQIHGGKTWRVHAPVWPDPLRDQSWDRHRAAVEAAASHEPLLTTELTAGDVLYLPRGYLHSATASGEVSIHLTVGVHIWTRAHLVDAAMEEIRRALAADPAMRASLPCGVDVSCASELAVDTDLVRAAVIRAAETIDVADLAGTMLARARASQRPAPLPVLAQVAAAADLGSHDCLVIRHHLLPALEPATTSPVVGGTFSALDSTNAARAATTDVVVRSRAGRCRIPSDAAPAVRRLLDGEMVAVAELLPADPDGALALARRLLIEGVAGRGPATP